MKNETPKNVKDLSSKCENLLNFEIPINGLNLEHEITLPTLLKSFENTGFQATNLYKAITEINKMKKSKIFLGCTSNLISSGIRDILTYLCKYKLIDVVVTTGGGIEEDLMKTLATHKLASFDLKGKLLRDNGFNRVGNIVIPNDNYFLFEKWFNDFLDKLLKGFTEEKPLILTPSVFIKKLGENIKDEGSFLYWAARNNIPVYSPALIDGSIGDMLTFYPNRSALKLDMVEDIFNMNYEAIHEENTAAIILGAGVVKHHILNSNLFRGGLDYCVIINTANEYDGSDAGANIEEAISWGKISKSNTAIKVFGDVTILFPLIVAGTFLKNKTRD